MERGSQRVIKEIEKKCKEEWMRGDETMKKNGKQRGGEAKWRRGRGGGE